MVKDGLKDSLSGDAMNKSTSESSPVGVLVAPEGQERGPEGRRSDARDDKMAIAKQSVTSMQKFPLLLSKLWT